MDDTTDRYLFIGEQMGWRQLPGEDWTAYYPLVGPELIHVHRVGTLTALTVSVDGKHPPDVLADVPWAAGDDRIELAERVAESLRRREATGEILDEPLRELLEQIAGWRRLQEPAAG
ncbi:hypothetical protein ACQP2E_14740 [Actinoplanes sp. CA-015351]|uniref:hypothetical protein n=1 Tax=Actinoplanes sp. CA-015351 TaxID=3239897 RepID=UPI003D97C99E